MLLRDLDLIDDIQFVHPKDMQDGTVEVSSRDITTNLPYVEGVHLAFDHHESETLRVGKKVNHIIHPEAPSAARVVFDYYGGAKHFPHVSDDIMAAVDKGDSANFTLDEVLDPQGWNLMNFLMDARTGLGRFRNFRISNYQLMMKLIEECRQHDIDTILASPDVAERVELYREHAEKFKEQLLRCSTIHDNLIILDLRDEETIWCGNRFMIYALYPQCNISIHVLWGRQQQNTVFAIGKSIFNRASNTHVGELCLRYAGGGHAAAGTCQVDNDKAVEILAQLREQICADGPRAQKPATATKAA